MTTYVGLLRGINVGSSNRIAMADLRAWVRELGHADVSTYIASGNVIFASDADDVTVVATAIEQKITAESGLAIDVVVRSHADLVTAVEANPFPDADGRRLLLGFLASAPAPKLVAGLGTITSGRDEARLVGTVLYLHMPDGMARSKLAEAAMRALGRGHSMTTRNLNTVRKLVELSA